MLLIMFVICLVLVLLCAIYIKAHFERQKELQELRDIGKIDVADNLAKKEKLVLARDVIINFLIGFLFFVLGKM